MLAVALNYPTVIYGSSPRYHELTYPDNNKEEHNRHEHVKES